MSKITDALAKLDPNNDNHWTSDGLPRIETVRMLAGDQNINRDSITAEAPLFSRQTANTPVAEKAAEVLSANPVEKLNYNELIAEGQEYLQKAIAERDTAQARVNSIQDKLDALINQKHEAGEGETTMDAIQGYLNSQKELLVERARRAQVLRDSGVTLADIQSLIPQASPIDQALAKKR